MVPRQLPRARPIDFSLIDRELRHRGVTLLLLWIEYSLQSRLSLANW